jgi:hypothetical protein
MMDKLLIRVAGDNRVVNAEVLLKHLSQSLRGIDMSAGEHLVEIDSEGGITLDGQKVYTPVRPAIAQKGRA